MRRLLFIVRKEFIQIFRNKAILPLITLVPIIQLIVLSYAADNEVRNVQLAIVDQDHSAYSRLLISKIRASDRFILVDAGASVARAKEGMQLGEVDVVLSIPPQFEKDFLRYKSGEIQLLVDAINGQQATVGAGYLSAIIQSFSQEIREDAAPMLAVQKRAGPQIKLEHAYWFNEELNYKHFMAPGIMGELVTILVMLLTAMNIVREREVGTIEQINVTPIRKWQFILGKMIPFLIIGLLLLTIGLTAGKLLFDVPMRGNLIVVFAYCLVNLAAVLGLGLFISNLSDTQQQAMFTTFFFVIIFILMSGLFTPIESMPQWAQWLTVPNPIAHFVNVMRSVLLKGSSFSDVSYNFWVTGILAVVFNFAAVKSYRKVV
ncbi:MAG: ABC transporter permease [Bacteroidetes bacterium]|nr:ABC transporter permease [Bacteroidota bacterium]